MKKFLPKTVNNPKGFTLVELLVVISVIAVLSVIGITIFSGTQKTARDSRRRADVDALSKAVEAHYNSSKDQYCTANAGTYCAPVAAWFASGSLPKDPQTSADYTGVPANGATTYNVCATLEGGGTYCKTQQQ
ncbi:type II secretion system protein [Candidatus Daviesbacteria bacterium]|nr:type II secretion system protein [Candidatus Daviesbacteria bacterium]